MSQMFANAVIDDKTGQSLEYRHLIQDPKYQKIWATSCANKFGRLAQDIGKRMSNGTNTIKFIKQGAVPQNKN
eukprot:9454998-Ditylum_brightwellii.AAC.1